MCNDFLLHAASGMSAHLLIEKVDVQGLDKAGKPPAAEVEKAVCKFGPFSALVFLPGRSAAVVSYLSKSAAEMVRFGSMLHYSPLASRLTRTSSAVHLRRCNVPYLALGTLLGNAIHVIHGITIVVELCRLAIGTLHISSVWFSMLRRAP